MKTKLTIALAVLLLAVLAMPELAEAQGYNVRRSSTVTKVAQYANNAMVSNLTFREVTSATAEVDIDDSDTETTLTIKIGYGLIVTNKDSARGDTTAAFTLWCDNDNSGTDQTQVEFEADCQATGQTLTDNPSATISNKDGKGVITIKIGADAQSFLVAGVRVDASALAIGDKVMASVTSTTDATTVGLGGSTSAAGVSGVVGEVADSLKVTASKDSDLACSSDDPEPSITVAEGFNMAWGPTNLAADSGGTDNEHASVKIVLAELPDGAKVEWPSPVNSTTKVGDTDRVNGVLTMDSAESSSNGKVVVYNYERKNSWDTGVTDDPNTVVDESMTDFTATQNNVARSFKIMPKKTTFTGDASLNISAMLHPMARRSTEGMKLGLEDMLSFEHPMEAPEDGKGTDWLVISECVTYLLYPFITCGATPGWSTGISVSNTTADGDIFGAFDEVEEQMGSVMMYGFPRGQPAPAEGKMVEPVVSTVSANLMAGDTITFDCGNTTMAGMEGYAIVKAAFQHARGMAFVLGNFSDGAAVDVSHGYMAEVIDDPLARDADPTDER